MRIIIGKPTKYITSGLDVSGDVARLYEMLPNILSEMDIDYKVLELVYKSATIRQEPNSIFLAWHLHGTLPNIWHLKTGPIPNYFYFDNNGYGPWSEIVAECNYKSPVEAIRKDVEKFCSDYIASNESRHIQPREAFIPAEPYVLVLGQYPQDKVMQYAHIDTESLMHKVADAFRGTRYTVATRGHPLTSGKPYGTADTFQVTGNMHTAIKHASAVYTVNSGSGFEALLHGKRVFTAGVCDYHWATTTVKTGEDIRKSIELIDEPIDEDNRIQFLHYFLNYHLMNINDTDSIKRKIIRAVSEYRDSTQDDNK